MHTVLSLNLLLGTVLSEVMYVLPQFMKYDRKGNKKTKVRVYIDFLLAMANPKPKQFWIIANLKGNLRSKKKLSSNERA